MALGKEVNFFDMFVTSVEYNCRIADALVKLVQNYDAIADLERETAAIHSIEHEADDHFHHLYEELNKSFITPIEREDILTLAQAIDDVTDSVEDVAYAFYCLNVTRINGEIKEFTGLIAKSCQDLKIAVTEFKKFKKSKVLNEKILDVNATEEVADRLYHQILRELFTSDRDTLEIVKLREVYRKLENCLDACEQVADILEGIVLKNS